MNPPRIARWLLARSLAEQDRSDVLANMDELFRVRVKRKGTLSATTWYGVQALTFAARLRLASDTKRLEKPSHRRGESMSQFIEDIRFALRSYRKSPAFTIAATMTLALGIGANAVIFSVVYNSVLRPLPFPEADQLVWLWPSNDLPLSLGQAFELQGAAEQFADLSAFGGRAFAITGGDIPDEVTGFAVSSNHFSVFGISPALGRAFLPEDAYPGAEPVVVLSHELWQSHFGGDSSIVGKRVDLFTAAAIPMIPGAFTGTPHTVVGIAPPRYAPFGWNSAVYTPLVNDPNDPNYSRMHELSVIGRTRPGMSAESLQESIAQLATRLPTMQSTSDDFARGTIVPMDEALVGHLRTGMLVTLGAVAMVLLIACANVANLVLVRTQARQRELALRHSLGATTRRIARQLLTESLVLSTMATVTGVVLASIATPVLHRFFPNRLAGLSHSGLSVPVLIFTAGLLAIATIICGIGPALRVSKTNQTAAARTTSNRVVTRSGHVLNRGLMVLEIALALSLAYGATMLVTSFVRLSNIEVGFNPADVMTLRIAPSEQRYSDVGTRRALVDHILDGVRNIPGVSNAGAIHFLPIADGGPSIYFLTDPTDPDARRDGSYRVVTPDYLETMEIPLLAGRTINEQDQAGTESVGLINRTMADLLWPGEDPLGRTLYRYNGQVFFKVIGVIGDVRQSALATPPRPEIYIPLTQTAWASSMTIVARIENTGEDLEPVFRNLVQSADGNLPITRVAWMDDVVSQSMSDPRFFSVLFSLFAVLALILGAIGVYGVSSYIASQRSNDIGIQLALGAGRWHILRSELKSNALLAGMGIVLGILAALSTSRLLTGFLFESSPSNPVILSLTSLLLALTALGGAFLPARRAASNDPMSALRQG